MAPRKKPNKKDDDDWEAELGEAADPTAAVLEASKQDEDAMGHQGDTAISAGGGGLMAAIKKNRNKKQKKGKAVGDFVEGEDAPDAILEPINSNPATDKDIGPPTQALEKANLDDEAFSLPAKKGKGSEQRTKQQHGVNGGQEGEDEKGDGDGKLKTKAEKEREKKEREKQRKKEQVQLLRSLTLPYAVNVLLILSAQ